jgi:hypothetical protein
MPNETAQYEGAYSALAAYLSRVESRSPGEDPPPPPPEVTYLLKGVTAERIREIAAAVAPRLRMSLPDIVQVLMLIQAQHGGQPVAEPPPQAARSTLPPPLVLTTDHLKAIQYLADRYYELLSRSVEHARLPEPDLRAVRAARTLGWQPWHERGLSRSPFD